MRKLLITVFVLIGLFSCQKEITDDVDSDNTGGDPTTNPANNPLIGTWTFDSATEQSNTRSETFIDGEDDVTLSSYTYTTQANNGSLKIDDLIYSLANFTYSVSTTINELLYTNGNFVDSFPTPFNYYQPPVNLNATYKLVGTDSIYFPNGAPSTDTTSHKPDGAKFVINSNRLTFTEYGAIDTSIDHSGYLAHETGTSIVKTYYHK